MNVWGVFHGIQCFLPRMLAGGGPGHVVNTSSTDGGVAPLPTASVYAVTKAAVVTMTESLYAHLKAERAPIGASVLFPGPHMLRTGLWESHRNRPARYAKARPRRTPYRSLAQWESAMKQAGKEVAFTPVEDVAAQVVDGVRGLPLLAAAARRAHRRADPGAVRLDARPQHPRVSGALHSRPGRLREQPP